MIYKLFVQQQWQWIASSLESYLNHHDKVVEIIYLNEIKDAADYLSSHLDENERWIFVSKHAYTYFKDALNTHKPQLVDKQIMLWDVDPLLFTRRNWPIYDGVHIIHSSKFDLDMHRFYLDQDTNADYTNGLIWRLAVDENLMRKPRQVEFYVPINLSWSGFDFFEIMSEIPQKEARDGMFYILKHKNKLSLEEFTQILFGEKDRNNVDQHEFSFRLHGLYRRLKIVQIMHDYPCLIYTNHFPQQLKDLPRNQSTQIITDQTSVETSDRIMSHAKYTINISYDSYLHDRATRGLIHGSLPIIEENDIHQAFFGGGIGNYFTFSEKAFRHTIEHCLRLDDQARLDHINAMIQHFNDHKDACKFEVFL